jgi:hypothetical protein
MYYAVSDKEVQNFFEKAWDLLVLIFNAFYSAISSAPHKVLGWVVVILLLAWIWKKIF